MAKNNASNTPGQFAQIFIVLRRTIELDRKNVWVIFVPTVAVLALGGFLSASNFGSGNWIMGILLIILSLLSTWIVFSLVLSNRAEKAAYASWEGQAGAVGAVLQTLLRRTWRGSESPVAVNPRTQDLVYRIVGKPGIVLIGEGKQSSVQTLVDAERRKLSKLAPGVPVHTIFVTEAPNAVKLSGVRKTANGLPKALRGSEIRVVGARLAAMGMQLPIPKGIDPRRSRPVRR